MSEPVAYFLTWTTYGTWLHGDERGWVDRRHNRVGEPYREGSDVRRQSAASAIRHAPVRLSPPQRGLVEKTIARVCDFNGWTQHAVNCRSNHVHVVVTAADVTPGARDEFTEILVLAGSQWRIRTESETVDPARQHAVS